jgi:hypothetical protein
MKARAAWWIGAAVALSALASCGRSITVRSTKSECPPGGPAIPKPSLGHDPAPFRIERADSHGGARPRRKVLRYGYRFEREPSGTTHTLRAVHFQHEGKVIVVGDAGTALLRDPAAGWTLEATGTRENLYAIVRAPFRPDGPVEQEREAKAPYVVVGARGTALLRTFDGKWRAEQTGTDRDLYGLVRLGTSTLAVGAGGTMVERSPEGVWRAVPSRTTADLFAAGTCSPHLCATGAGGIIVDCVRPDGKLVCIPRPVAPPADLRAIADDGTLFGNGVLLSPARTPGGVWSPPPEWQPSPYANASIGADEMHAVWDNHWMGADEHIAVGRGGVVWLISNRYERAEPFERFMLPFGVDLYGVAFELVDGFLVGERGTIVHLSVEGMQIPTVCLL